MREGNFSEIGPEANPAKSSSTEEVHAIHEANQVMSTNSTGQLLDENTARVHDMSASLENAYRIPRDNFAGRILSKVAIYYFSRQLERAVIKRNEA